MAGWKGLRRAWQSGESGRCASSARVKRHGETDTADRAIEHLDVDQPGSDFSQENGPGDPPSAGVLMLDPDDHNRPLRVGSLFSGYGGLDLAIEHALDAETVWFSEINQQVAGIFSHHWPGVPNLGDITTIDWREVPPVDVLC